MSPLKANTSPESQPDFNALEDEVERLAIDQGFAGSGSRPNLPRSRPKPLDSGPLFSRHTERRPHSA